MDQIILLQFAHEEMDTVYALTFKFAVVAAVSLGAIETVGQERRTPIRRGDACSQIPQNAPNRSWALRYASWLTDSFNCSRPDRTSAPGPAHPSPGAAVLVHVCPGDASLQSRLQPQVAARHDGHAMGIRAGKHALRRLEFRESGHKPCRRLLTVEGPDRRVRRAAEPGSAAVRRR